MKRSRAYIPGPYPMREATADEDPRWARSLEDDEPDEINEHEQLEEEEE